MPHKHEWIYGSSMTLLRRGRMQVRRLDALACAALLLVAESQIWLDWSFGGVGTASHGDRLARGLLVVATVGPLAWRKRRPLPVVATICAAMVLQLLVVTPSLTFLGALLPMAIANYTGAAYAARWRAASLTLVLATETVIYAVVPEERVQGEVLFSVFVAFGTWLAGDVVRGRLARADLTVSTARRLVEERTAQAAVTLTDERARIARELHDVIAHSVSVMGVQAGAARTLLDNDDAAAARDAVLAIEATARSSVAELQRLLAVLRASDASPERRHPQPGLAMLGALVDQVRAAGLPVTISADPVPPLSTGLDLVAFRIVQESLTNALKHSASPGALPTTVTVAQHDGQLHLEIHNTGAATSARTGTPGHGLIGMRERVHLYGGTLHAGPAPTGGYLVRATLPIADDPGIEAAK